MCCESPLRVLHTRVHTRTCTNTDTDEEMGVSEFGDGEIVAFDAIPRAQYISKSTGRPVQW